MGRTRLFKRLRKQASYKYEPQGRRQYAKRGITMAASGARAAYRALKTLARQSTALGKQKSPIARPSQTARRKYLRENPCWLDSFFVAHPRTHHDNY